MLLVLIKKQGVAILIVLLIHNTQVNKISLATQLQYLIKWEIQQVFMNIWPTYDNSRETHKGSTNQHHMSLRQRNIYRMAWYEPPGEGTLRMRGLRTTKIHNKQKVLHTLRFKRLIKMICVAMLTKSQNGI